MKRTCLIVSPYFPPSTLAGVHRARHLAKHLPSAGWNPIVVCVDEIFHEERLDPGLLSLVPSSVEVKKVRALPASMTRLFGIGDISLRAYSQLRNTVFRTLGLEANRRSPHYRIALLSDAAGSRNQVPVWRAGGSRFPGSMGLCVERPPAAIVKAGNGASPGRLAGAACRQGR